MVMRYGSSIGRVNGIKSVLEIRLCEDIWNRVQGASALTGKSYSWVVRYAVFRLIRRARLRDYIGYAGNPAFCDSHGKLFRPHPLNRKVWARRSESGIKHRHRLCLYGEDELFIRLAAARLGCTMTHLVRLALEKYLAIFIDAWVHSRSGIVFFYWLGIKIFKGVEFHTFSKDEHIITYEKFSPKDFF